MFTNVILIQIWAIGHLFMRIVDSVAASLLLKQRYTDLHVRTMPIAKHQDG